MFFINHKTLFFSVSAILVALSIVAVAFFGLKLGIDFTGGTLMEVTYPADRPAKEVVEAALSDSALGTFSVRPVDEQGYLIRVRELSESERAQVVQALSLNGSVLMEVTRLNTVGPVVGAELKNKSIVALLLVLVIIILYVAFAFRSVSVSDGGEVELRLAPGRVEKRKAPPAPKVGVSSWVYGVVAVVTLFHDIIIPLGIFAILGGVLGVELDILFVMALLAILGYSVNDTIVVFDRIRENLRGNLERGIEEPFREVVGNSLSQTLARSINTSLTTLLVLLALLFFGGASTTYFVLALTIGVIAGAFSSIAFASPLLVAIEAYQMKRKSA